MSYDNFGGPGAHVLETSRTPAERLIDLRASVSPEGEAASFDLLFTNQTPFRCELPYSDMPGFFAEIRHAANLMINRQALRLDSGADQTLEMCQMALRPAIIEIIVDPLTSDRLFLFQFHDHAPVALRISAAELPMMLQQLAEAIRRSQH
ncbi:MAG TPA: hypothetical protein VGN80_19255 [Devosiaceae bacterium]|jgi:hypothetical protein|nr:hypothetical protein [Devosiaceae bacterium]